MKETFYITTPIYYVTDAPHLGTLYTTILSDTMARYKRLCGDDVFFLTGTDEHGQKVEKKAREQGLSPQVLSDTIVLRYKETWQKFDITNDDFIRTTEERHKKTVQKALLKMMAQGDIYLGHYEGWYCTPCETYLTETNIKDGQTCPECARKVEKLQEESYFFRLSKYIPSLIEYIERHDDFIIPKSRKNEVLRFCQDGVHDLSISRIHLAWGIDWPEENTLSNKKHKVYVWVDALMNYLSALAIDIDSIDRQTAEASSLFTRYWKNAHHVIGKDIIKFHAIYWPCFLMSLGVALPKRIIAHGWITVDKKKMSKSFGNKVDPLFIGNLLTSDGVRYFLLRDFTFGEDGDFSLETVIQHLNAYLADEYGNAIQRVSTLFAKAVEKGLDVNKNSSFKRLFPRAMELDKEAASVLRAYHECMRDFQMHGALKVVSHYTQMINQYIEQTAPWKLLKNREEHEEDLLSILFSAREALLFVTLLLSPFIPNISQRAMKKLGLRHFPSGKISSYTWGDWYAIAQQEKFLFPTVFDNNEIIFKKIELPS